MSAEKDKIFVALSPQEVMRLEMILADRDREEALVFVTEMYQKIKDKTIRGLKSHLDI
jgi:hypothetical protein